MGWVVLVVLGGVAMWPAVCLILASISGWSALVEKYAAGAHPRTPRKISGGRVGNVTYGGALSLSAQPGGFAVSVLLPFRVGHPPLFIPWSDVTESAGEFMGQKTTVFRVRGVPDAAIEIPPALAAWLKVSPHAESPKPAG
ncbi:MAG: hypothetical protein ABIQ16_26360 [Polyangiaceae bacterium]